MKIDFITPKFGYFNAQNTKNKHENNTQTNLTTNPIEIQNQYNDQLVFEARVDKGLTRFYEFNKDRMPITVKDYIESLSEKTISPLEAQKNAFKNLNLVKTIEDIKNLFPNENLFKNLIPATQTKATRGILQSVRENLELLELSGQGVLQDKSDLTVYLVKKVFLEGKTIDEINNDLEGDLDKDFQADFKFKNKDSKYIYSSTLKALGIELPPFEYMQSLRYTREGYSDLVGENISKGQIEFWNSLSEEERTARAKKSVTKFENWWSTLSRKQIIEMIADQTTAIDMLKAFKRNEKNKQILMKSISTNEKDEIKPTQEKIKTKVGSTKLSQDELFIKWATNNLKLFEASLTEAEKDTLHLKRMQRLVQHWASMSPEERTDYISKMKSGSEPLRYTMIDAWNNSSELIIDLSEHLRKNQIYKPADMLFSNIEFSKFQSEIMSEFWKNHPEYSELLGNKIKLSQEKINDAISRGTFEELKKEIMRNKNQRIKEMENYKKSQEIKTSQTKYPQYVEEFKDAYFNGILKPRLKQLPRTYLNDFIDVITNDIPEKCIKSWTKNLKGEELTAEDKINLKLLADTEPKSGAIINRAIEAAIASTLYNCTKDPEVYLMSHSDVKTALYKLDKGDNPIELGSLKLQRDFILPVIKKHIDSNNIERLYKTYKTPLLDIEIEGIINKYFSMLNDNTTEKSLNYNHFNDWNSFQYNELMDYLKEYGQSLLILFSNKSMFPTPIKQAFYQKIKNNAPSSLKETFKYCVFEKHNAFELEEKLKSSAFAYASKYPFLPTFYSSCYQDELMKAFRKTSEKGDYNSLDYFNEYCTTKRKNPKEHGKIVIIPKSTMNTENKLKMLIIEQALADVLYESTRNKEVYAMEFEDLCDNLELFNLVKHFPSEERNYFAASLQKNISLTAYKKLNLGKINKLAEEYKTEIQSWAEEYNKNKNPLTLEDLVYILNPDETKAELDEKVIERIKKYNLNLK